MTRSALYAAPGVAALCAAALLVAGCGSSSEGAPTSGEKLTFKLTDAGCVPSSTKVDAGPIVFEAENTGTTAVTEIEVLEGSKVLGEKENLADGLSGGFTLTLDPGRYTLYCPGGETERGPLIVTGKGAGHPASSAEGEAVTQHRR
jgi:iron uptake system component EfeO